MIDNNQIIDILLVEDSPDDRELTAHALEAGHKGLRILHLKDGVEAIDFIFGRNGYENRKFQTDLKLVLLDLKLPRVDGLEVLKRIRSDERTKTLPVVILTSSREKKDILESYRLGVNSYVVKPVGFDSYVKAISTLAFYWSTVNEKPVKLINEVA